MKQFPAMSEKLEHGAKSPKASGSRNDHRTKSEMLVDLHIYLMPVHLWKSHQNSAAPRIADEAISEGYIRVHPESVLHDVRPEIVNQLGHENIPHDYVFLRCIGRSFTRVKPKQEQELKVKYFLPPQTQGPELYILDAAAATGRSSATDSSVASLDVHSDVSRRHHAVPSIVISGARDDHKSDLDIERELGIRHVPDGKGNHEVHVPDGKGHHEVHVPDGKGHHEVHAGHGTPHNPSLSLQGKEYTFDNQLQPRDMWKKKYMEEKKTTGPKVDHAGLLRLELDQLNSRIVGKLETIKDEFKNDHADPDHKKKVDKVTDKITSTRLEQEIEDLQERLQTTKAKLSAETKMRTQKDKDLLLMKAEGAQHYKPNREHTEHPQANTKHDTGHHESDRSTGHTGREFEVIKRSDGSSNHSDNSKIHVGHRPHSNEDYHHGHGVERHGYRQSPGHEERYYRGETERGFHYPPGGYHWREQSPSNQHETDGHHNSPHHSDHRKPYHDDHKSKDHQHSTGRGDHPHSPGRGDHPHIPGRGDHLNSTGRGDHLHIPGRGDHPHSPGHEDHPHSPGRGDHPHSPGHGDHLQISGRGDHPHSPRRGDHPHSPGRGDHPHSPGHGDHLYIPGRGDHPHSPGRGDHLTSPGRQDHLHSPGRGDHTGDKHSNQRGGGHHGGGPPTNHGEPHEEDHHYPGEHSSRKEERRNFNDSGSSPRLGKKRKSPSPRRKSNHSGDNEEHGGHNSPGHHPAGERHQSKSPHHSPNRTAQAPYEHKFVTHKDPDVWAPPETMSKGKTSPGGKLEKSLLKSPMTERAKATNLADSFRIFATKDGGREAANRDIVKWCADAGVLSKHLNSNHVDIAFAKVKPMGAKFISVRELNPLIDEMALKYKDDKNCDMATARKKLSEKLAHSCIKMHGTTHAMNAGHLDRLTDTTKYTGTHKERFDASGKGKGLDGRENRVEYHGYVHNFKK